MRVASGAIFVILAAALGAAACGSDDSKGGSGGSSGSAGSAGSAGSSVTPIGELPAGFNEMLPGGETICARGTPFRYFVRPGTVNRVVVEFRGGGACWNQLTCSIGENLFQEQADADPHVMNELSGIYQHDNAENPFKDWHHVYIPYCTGDVHWGNAEVNYGDFSIQHKGAVNVRAVLDWLYQAAPSPEKIFVTGCSAGAYGSILWAAHIRNHYTSSEVYHFADSGAGVITDTFFQESFPTWNAIEAYPTFIPGVDPSAFNRLPQLYQVIGNHFSEMFLSQYNTAYDDNQHFYYEAMGGGDAYEWSDKMKANVNEIATSTPNFRSFLAPDHKHCIIPYPEFYTVTSNGVRLIDWINQAINGENPASVSCEPNCGAPETPDP